MKILFGMFIVGLIIRLWSIARDESSKARTRKEFDEKEVD